MAAGCTFAVFLAGRGITGPAEVFEGNKGFKDAIAGDFAIDWQQEDLERVTRTILKKYNAEIHAQSAIDAVLGLSVRGEEVDRVDVEIFDVAYHIIGGGEEGDKTGVRTKEEADHSLPYMLAAAILDGQVMPAQCPRAHRPGRRAVAAAESGRQAECAALRAFSGRARVQGDRHLKERPHARIRAARLRRLSLTTHELGCRAAEVRLLGRQASARH
jgi:hypothetical protein